MEIGPSNRKYGESDAYRNVTNENRGKTSIGPDGSLAGYTGGLPFPNDEIDCEKDPNAASKIIWNFVKAWNGDGAMSNFRYTYWDNGERLPIYYEGTSKVVNLKDRVEPQYRKDEESAGDIFKNEKRGQVTGIEIEGPMEGRGSRVMFYRYDSSDGPRDEADNDDIWIYVPDQRRVRHYETTQTTSGERIEAINSTDFTFDDLRSFSGIPPQFHWACLGEREILAPFNTKHLAYPYEGDYNFGPYGVSFANDRWELRKTWVIRMDPKDDRHPYHHKDLYIDRETYEPLYSFAYDRKSELWKVIWHNHRYSEDWDGTTPERTDPKSKDGVWYKGWEGVERPNDMRTVSDIVVNVQSGTGNRLEFWDAHGMPFPTEGKLRRYISVGRLAKSRGGGNSIPSRALAW
jgi:hypothetical protein